MPNSLRHPDYDRVRKRNRVATAAVGVAVVVGMALPFLKDAVKVKAIERALSPSTEARWTHYTAGGLSILAPRSFSWKGFSPIPIGYGEQLESIENYESQLGDLTIRISVTKAKSGLPLSLDGAARGAMDNMARTMDPTGFRYTVDSVEQLGVPARRLAGTFSIGQRLGRFEALLALRNNVLFQVLAVAPDDSTLRPRLGEVVRSVAIAP
jgi:hypothetical protein